MNRKNSVIIVASIIIAFLLLKESGLFDLYCANYSISKSCKYELRHNTFSISTSRDGLRTDFGNRKLSQADIFIRGIGEVKLKSSDTNVLDVTITNVSIPFSFVPFYTNISYEVEALINDNISAVKTDSQNVRLAKTAISGNISVKGSFKSYGLLSNRQIQKIIMDDATLYLKQATRDYLVAND